MKKRMLIVDDMSFVADSIQNALSQHFIADTANSALQALQMLAQRQYDGILVDVRLDGGVGGLELTQRLRASGMRVKILVMSAYTPDDAVRRRTQELGATYIPKPASTEEICRAMEVE